MMRTYAIPMQYPIPWLPVPNISYPGEAAVEYFLPNIKKHVKDVNDEEKVKDYLARMLNKEVFDKSSSSSLCALHPTILAIAKIGV